MSKEIKDPANNLAEGDPGDQTQRNFRYQNAYGAILLIAASAGIESYRAIWCEHHEDLLAERNDGTYDAFQIKTRQPENGYWKTDHDEIKKSIKRFIGLNEKFDSKIHIFVIVSNAEFFKCGLDVKPTLLSQSPIRLLEAIHSINDPASLPEPFLTVIKNLAAEFDCDPLTVFSVLKKTHLKKGPSREDFDADICHNHLPQVPSCKLMAQAILIAVRDEIIQKVFQASSLLVDDPKKYLVTIDSKDDPILLAKRVPSEIVTRIIQSSSELIFRYQPVDITIKLGENSDSTQVLEKKFIKGNLIDQLQTMKRRKISSERRLFELNAAFPENFENILTQLESTVQAECDEAALALINEIDSDKYGPLLLNNVYERLRNLAESKPKGVFNETYETLVGMAGLLTENCSVWWSKKFDLTDAA